MEKRPTLQEPMAVRSLSSISDPPTPPELTERSERELLEALYRGEVRAAGWLYDHLRPSIDRALRRVLYARHRDFDDLMQSTFERVLRGLIDGRFEGRSSLRTWASAIAGHVALDALRSRSREERRSASASDEGEWGAEPRLEGRLDALAELRRLQGILSRMKPDLAETLILADVLGHSLEEIARLRGAGLSATQARLHRARLELRRRVGTSKGDRA